MPRTYSDYLQDILAATASIETHTRDLDYEQFQSNELIVKAILYDLSVIGEAARAIPDHLRQRYPQVEWRRIVALRNIVTHEYFGVDMAIIWNIVTDHVPRLHSQVLDIIADLDTNERES